MLLPEIEDAAGTLFETSAHPEVVAHEAGAPQLFLAHIAENLCFVVAGANDAPVGFATCGVLDRALHLYELSVLPDHGGRGLGRALIGAVCAEAKSRGLDAVTLSTFADIPWNAPFYARVGFTTLRNDELSPGLHLVVNHEMDIGLSNRCIMRRDI